MVFSISTKKAEFYVKDFFFFFLQMAILYTILLYWKVVFQEQIVFAIFPGPEISTLNVNLKPSSWIVRNLVVYMLFDFAITYD